MTKQISATLSDELYTKAKDNDISLSGALQLGIKIHMREKFAWKKEVFDYINDLADTIIALQKVKEPEEKKDEE